MGVCDCALISAIDRAIAKRTKTVLNLFEKMAESTKKVRATGPQIRAARDLLEITQRQLADAADVDITTVSAYERGSHPAYNSTAMKIQEALERRGITFTNSDRPSVTLDRSKAVIPT